MAFLRRLTQGKSSRRKRLAVVFSLSGCLVHTVPTHSNQVDAGEVVKAEENEVVKRPGLDTFLQIISKTCDLYIYTNEEKAHVDKILQVIDPSNKYFQRTFHREQCTLRDGHYLKDLSIIETDLSRIVLVDCHPMSFYLQPENGIPISQFANDLTDSVLMHLNHIIACLASEKDVRPTLYNMFRLDKVFAKGVPSPEEASATWRKKKPAINAQVSRNQEAHAD